jgi:SAM-dependent methyltransferase
MLGREPESEAAIKQHMAARDHDHLSEVFLTSLEFKDRVGVHVAGLPIALSPIEVEFAARPAELSACLTKIKDAWAHLGTVRPHFSVLTDQRFLPENLDGNIDTFWASGQGEVEGVLQILARYGFKSFRDKNCVEYGCGVGRVTVPLAQKFRRVDGYDISSSHLVRAQHRADQVAARNVFLHQCASTVLPELEKCDLFYSRIVFQHNPPPVIVELIRRALAALKPRGVAVFQVPTYIAGYQFRVKEYLATEHVLDMQMHCLPQKVVFDLVNEQGCSVLEVREDGACGAPSMILSNLFVVRRPE